MCLPHDKPYAIKLNFVLGSSFLCWHGTTSMLRSGGEEAMCGESSEIFNGS